MSLEKIYYWAKHVVIFKDKLKSPAHWQVLYLKQMHLINIILDNEKQTNHFRHSASFQIKLQELFKSKSRLE